MFDKGTESFYMKYINENKEGSTEQAKKVDKNNEIGMII
jgi:hypothetical protein